MKSFNSFGFSFLKYFKYYDIFVTCKLYEIDSISECEKDILQLT